MYNISPKFVHPQLFMPKVEIALLVCTEIIRNFNKTYFIIRRELSEDLKETIVKLHKSCLGHKKISERIHISGNTVDKMVQKFKKYRCCEA